MYEFSGKSVSEGIVFGKIKVFTKNQIQVEKVQIQDLQEQQLRFRNAIDSAKEQLQLLWEKATREIGATEAAIFEVHQMMLEDREYLDAVEDIIVTQRVNAEYAVAVVGEGFSRKFLDMKDEYMQGRAADVIDISERLICIMSGQQRECLTSEDSSIILAQDLAPSETTRLDKDKILSIVTIGGSVNSHTAILARTMGIPALVATNIGELDMLELNGKEAVVDGKAGRLYVEPDEKTRSMLRARWKEQEDCTEEYESLRGMENISIDGKRIEICANAGSLADLDKALQNDAEGIGLFRSEFIYMEKNRFPTEEEQYCIYKEAAERMKGKRIIIRTLDIGADKQCAYFGLQREDNPAMGMRAIRICLTRPELFKTQIRALLRASKYGRIAIMYPMITSQSELTRIKGLVEEARRELEEEGIPYGSPEQGIMIETPAAVMISDLLAGEVDFFSIGTNDLTQYTLAMDRQNHQLEDFYEACHPAILRMIQMVVDNGHKAGIWVGICGELAADMTLTRAYLAMGVDELSVVPSKILALRKAVLETKVE